jgi:hypothetical protein
MSWEHFDPDRNRPIPDSSGVHILLESGICSSLWKLFVGLFTIPSGMSSRMPHVEAMVKRQIRHLLRRQQYFPRVSTFFSLVVVNCNWGCICRPNCFLI